MKISVSKVFAAMALCLAIPLSICACAPQAGTSSSTAGKSSSAAVGTTGSSAAASASSSSTASSSKAAQTVAIDWTTKDYEEVCSDGYHLLQTVKVSPWIDSKKTDCLSAAWAEVSNGREFPTLSQFDASSLGEDQVAYAVGTLSVKNATNGFGISPSSGISTYFNMSLKQPGGYGVDAVMLVYYDDKTQICHTNGASFQPNSGALMAKMSSDSWGPVPFAIVMENRKTPNEPDGKNLADYRFVFSDGEPFEIGAM